MEKILWVVNPCAATKNALDFAAFMARLTRSKLTGVFLDPDPDDGHRRMAPGPAYFAGAETAAYQMQTAKLDVSQCIHYFEEGCEQRGLHYETLRLPDLPLEGLLAESHYADLLLLDASTTLYEGREGLPSDFAREVFRSAGCPVIVPPAEFLGIDEVVFCYDGTPSALQAMKLFTYLLPQMSDKRVHVLELVEENREVLLDKAKVRAWLQAHYSEIGFEVEKGPASTWLFSYFLKKQKQFIVMGAYGRGKLSSLLHHSSADNVLRTIDQPLFLAHC
ncbi:universal stress protein [Paraflavisolibacter sp. H34]|uniref:universal stress protein n=1 Tax=Huijunlia imazamoxiresistens TaxID=3127457 RepID=UPI003019BD7B